MVRRLWTGVLLFLAAWAGGGQAVAQQYPASPRIVAVGDLHGDYEAWIAIARDARLIDARNRWTGGRATLVQLGDITDRGPDSLKIIRHLQKLQKEAARAGGRVIVLVGNHEAMNVTGDLRYVHAGEYAAFADRNSEARRDAVYEANENNFLTFYRARDPSLSPQAIRDKWISETPLGEVEHQAAWSPAGELGKWTASLPPVAKIGDRLVVHGGLSAPYTAMGGLDEINRRVSAALKAGETAPASIINDPLGPLWYRGLLTRGPAFEKEVAAAAAASGVAAAPRPPIAEELDLVLTAFGAKRLVVGHTPQVKGIAALHGGKLMVVDTGNSRAYGGQPSWLEIVGAQVTPHMVARSGG